MRSSSHARLRYSGMPASFFDNKIFIWNTTTHRLTRTPDSLHNLSCDKYNNIIQPAQHHKIKKQTVEINHSASATHDECSSSCYYTSVSVWSCATSVEAAALVCREFCTRSAYLCTSFALDRHRNIYLIKCIFQVSTAGIKCRLRSTDIADYVLPRTRTKLGQHGFCFFGPATIVILQQNRLRWYGHVLRKKHTD